ncbi:MAG TPA: M56 family metallopeptidase, partial [Bryobacteraceae bacterium]|nr:M56 family metallopeptidase [Bryobacteraceae bacterium]
LPPLGIASAPIEPAWTLPSAPAATPAVAVRTGAVSTKSAPRQTPRQIPWVPFIWSAGALAVLGHLAVGIARMNWLARRATRIDALPGAAQLAANIGAGRVEFLESDRIAMPMTWGVIRPRILLPTSHIGWPAERLRLVVAHELIHVEQRDCLIQLLMQAACALYWFHPLAWLGAAQFRRERERACDDGVIRLGINGPEYAGHLLELVRSLKTRSASGVGSRYGPSIESRKQADGAVGRESEPQEAEYQSRARGGSSRGLPVVAAGIRSRASPDFYRIDFRLGV